LVDVESHVYERLTTVCHLWPAISPWNVFDLEVDVWLMFARAADDYNKSMKDV
jgi:hypothetical protein